MSTVAEVNEMANDDGNPLDDLPTPHPVPDLATYLEERRLRLAFSPDAQRNYDAYQQSSRRDACPDYLPTRLDFENVSRCNFHCTMCTVSDWPKGKRANDMSLKDFKRLIDEQTGLVEIKVQGLGEPTLQGDDFFEMIRYARARHIWVRTTTNASLLHLKDNYRKLIDSGVNEVQISCDGADEATFQAIRRGSVFSQVVENCTRINAYCAERQLIRTKMWTVIQKANRHQLPQLVDLAARMGFRSQAFALNLVDFGLERWRATNDKVAVQSSFRREDALALIEQGQRLGIKVAFWSVTQKYRTDKTEHLCPWPFERAYIGSDLRVAPCCTIGNPDVCEVGVANPDFTNVWNGETLQAFRQAHLDGKIPSVCRSCYTESDEQ